jgi:hypothetical protein
MLGIKDPVVALAYILCIVSTLMCVVYGWYNWNKGEDKIEADDVKWAAEEDKEKEQE